MKKWLVALVVLVLVCLAVPAGAQQFGTLVGQIVDDTGAGMPGVSVTITGPTLQGKKLVQTDVDGQFRIQAIPPGRDFKIVAELEGFQTAVKSGVTVQLNNESNAGRIVMKFGDVKETVIVEAKSIVVDTTKSTVDNNVDWGLLDTLATNRSFQGVMSMAPGTQVSANPTNPVNNPAVHGGQDDDNLYLINGFNQTDPRTLTWGNAINYDTIAEIQLSTAGWEAEFGRTAGGIINLVTKSGGNELHGTARFVLQDRDFQGDPGTYDYCDPTKYTEDGTQACSSPEALARWQTENPDSESPRHKKNKAAEVATTERRPEGTIGGYILKDALWYYLSYEQRSREQDFNRPVPVRCEGTPDSDPELRCLDKPGPIDTSTYDGFYASAKMTWQVAPSVTAVGYYNSDPIDISNTLQRYSADAFVTSESAENIQEQGGYLAGVNLTGVFGQSTFGDLKVSWYDANLNVVPQYTMDAPNYFDLDAYYNFGGSYNSYKSTRQNLNVIASVSQFVDDLLGSHTFKAGAEYLASKTKETDIYNHIGQFYGSGFDYGNPGSEGNKDRISFYILIDDKIDVEHKQDYWGLYLQDKWQLKGLTVNYGVRFESLDTMNNQGKSVKKFGFSDHIQPRLGFAYDLSNTGVSWLAGSAVRGSWSRFRQFVASGLGDNLDEYPNGYNVYCFKPNGQPGGSACDDYWGGAVVPLAGEELFVVDPDLSNPYVDEWTIGIDFKLSRSWAGGIGWVDRRYKNGIFFLYYDDSRVYTTNLSLANTKYGALELSLKKAMIDDQLQLNASWTHTFTNEGIAGHSPKGSLGPGGSYGSCADPGVCVSGRYGSLDSPDNVKINGSYSQPWGEWGTTTLGLSDYYYSGEVYGAYWSRGNDGADYVVSAGSSRVGSWNRVDLHLEHEYKFQRLGGISLAIYGDVFNVLNRQSALNRSGYMGTDATFQETQIQNDSFGYPSRWQNPRVYQFGMKLEF
jgi:hypothetical protein